MWKILLRALLQNNNHCREKYGWYISLQKIQARAMVSKHFLKAYSRMFHLKKKRIRDSHLTNITNKQAGKDRQCTLPTDMVLKSVKSSCSCDEAKDICETM